MHRGRNGYVAQRTNFLVQRMAGSTSGYYFGGNLYAEDDEAIADRASFANESGNTIYAAVPTMIRNASDLKVTIRNAETGEVYKTVDYGTATGAYYSASSAAWSATGTQVNLSWRGTAADNKTLLPEGTPIEVVARAVSEYYWDRGDGDGHRRRREPAGRAPSGRPASCWTTPPRRPTTSCCTAALPPASVL